MKKFRCLAIAAALSAAVPSAEAVVLNPQGLGQVLIYPYYTVNGFGTLLSVVNSTQKGKALKVRFREGYNGRYVLDFNLYVSPFDAWTAELYDDGTGLAAIATRDNSCTVPEIPAAPEIGPGVKAVPFRIGEFSEPNSDGGPAGIARTREGYFEIIEMGEVVNGTHNTLEAITQDATGRPADCEQLSEAWTGTNGYWAINPQTDLTPPGGGLYGAESIINVGEGTMYTVNALAIDGFSDVVQNTLPGDERGPDLNTATKNAAGLVSAYVPIGNHLVQADYQKPEDAISALFMADSLFNEYVVNQSVGATSDWIVTFPTKRFYTDPDLLGGSPQPRAPFEAIFTANGSCASVAAQLFDRETRTPAVQQQALCFAANSLTIGTNDSALSSNLRSATFVDTQSAGFVDGHLRLSLTHDAAGDPVARHALTSSNGITLQGLPAAGFLAVGYVNAAVTPGVLANYNGAYPHHATVSCTSAAQAQGNCQ